ncbi:MAG: hypothetical protein KDD66_01410 [Bdellovibrionales bacterium]|nr:hypothetical protein [Bdellovibrionales bacterium]
MKQSVAAVNIVALLLLLWMCACSEDSGPPGHLLIRNDIQDKQYNEFVIDSVEVKGARSGFRRMLAPGEKVVLPQRAVTRLRFTRKYKDYSLVYIVSCPKDLTQAVTIKLIDVHTGRLQGGCSLVRKGKKVQGLTRWSGEE